MSTRLLRLRPDEQRNAEQLREQYLVEKELATRLRMSSAAERGKLYSAVYDELFRRIPHHSQLLNKASAEQRSKRIEQQLNFLAPWLQPQTKFLEVGAGDCALSFAVARKVAHVYAVDVSASITDNADKPQNFTLILSDGTSIPVADGSITLAYSNQLMEHLHPDDALQQLANIHRALARGGVYICLTPNRLTGPHDISQYFDSVATGFHLKEYTFRELIPLFRRVGFSSVSQCFRKRNARVRIPGLIVRSLERSIDALPRGARTRASSTRAVRGLLDICLIATK